MASRKKNKWEESIIPDNNEFCYLCKKKGLTVRGTDCHHMVYGTAKRKLADEDGLHVQLCHLHHMMLHQQGYYREELQQYAEQMWLDHYGKTIDDWIQRYGKNFL